MSLTSIKISIPKSVIWRLKMLNPSKKEKCFLDCSKFAFLMHADSHIHDTQKTVCLHFEQYLHNWKVF